jgi:hypothetical protein
MSSPINIPCTQPEATELRADDKVITKGKYKGEKYDDMLDKDFNYCYWYYTTLNKNLPFNKYLETKKDLLIECNQIVTFGKYKGEEFSTIAIKDDDAYKNWVKNIAEVNSGNTKNISNLARLRSYLISVELAT